MEALLGALWLGEDVNGALPVLDQASLSLCRQRVREVAAAQGLPTTVCESMAIVATELGQNQLRHASAGVLLVRPCERDGELGVELVAADEGPGISDPAAALRGDQSTAGGLGIGLSGARRLADEMDIDVRVGEGTCLWARKFARPARRRREVGVYGVPLAGENRNGDVAGFRREAGGLLLIVADGLGHGIDAREAAGRAVLAVLGDDEALASGPAPLLERAGVALSSERGMRGAVVAVARLGEPALPRRDRLAFAAAGDVAGCVFDEGRLERLLGGAFVLGRAGYRTVHMGRRPPEQELALGPGGVVALFSDGLHARATPPPEPQWRDAHPLILAQQMHRTHGRGSDDALVLVAR